MRFRAIISALALTLPLAPLAAQSDEEIAKAIRQANSAEFLLEQCEGTLAQSQVCSGYFLGLKDASEAYQHFGNQRPLFCVTAPDPIKWFRKTLALFLKDYPNLRQEPRGPVVFMMLRERAPCAE